MIRIDIDTRRSAPRWALLQRLVFDPLVIPPEGYQPADVQRYIQENVIAFLTGDKPLDEYDVFVDTLYGQFGYQAVADAASELEPYRGS